MKKILLFILILCSCTAFGQIKFGGIKVGSFTNTNQQSYVLAVTSYPASVYDVNGKNVGIATTAAEYVQAWNAAPANQPKGSLSSVNNLLNFLLSIANGQTAPAYLGVGVIDGQWLEMPEGYLVDSNDQLIIIQ